MPEGELFYRGDKLIPQRQFLLHQIGAGDAQMDTASGEFAGDFARREQDQRHALNAFDGPRVFTFGARALQGDPARGKPLKGFLHQTPFGGHTEFDRHWPASSSSISPGRMTPPTAGISPPCPSRRVSAS